MNSGEKEECLMSCEVVKGSADGDAEWNWGAQIQAKDRRWGLRSAYAAEQPIHAEQRQKGREVKSLEWNRGAPNRGWGGDWGAPIVEEERGQKRQYGVRNEISQHQSRQRRAEEIEEGRWGLRSPYYSGQAPLGGVRVLWSSPPCVIWIWWVQWLRQKCNLSPWKGKIYLDIHLENT